MSSHPRQLVDINEYRQFNPSIELIPRTRTQEKYICSLLDEQVKIVFGTGPAGTGKTMLGVLAALRALKNGDVTKIVLTRPAVGVDNERHGFLPGDLNAKMEPWTKPIFDVIHKHFSPRDTARMLDEDILEISPLAFMRGRSFDNCFIVADECQNATPNQLKMLLTRLGENTRMVVTGDLQQSDFQKDNGLQDFLSRLTQHNPKLIDWIEFAYHDIQRSEVVKEVLHIYGED